MSWDVFSERGRNVTRNPEYDVTRDEFEKKYTENSGITLEWLHDHRQFAVPCNCEYEKCHGWQMVTIKEE